MNTDSNPDPSISRDERNNRLKNELRDHIRTFGDFKFLSVEWLKMTESLLQVSNIAYMESHIPGSEAEKFKFQQGKKLTGTLWDQEKDEVAIRILLEEGKLNLLLRMLQNFKGAERQGNFNDYCLAVGKQFDVDIIRVMERCKTFERSCGNLMHLSFQHVEALQILDLPNLLQYIGEILQFASKIEDKMQEQLVSSYLACIGAKMEDLNEDRVMELLLENQIIPSYLDYFVKYQHSTEEWGWFVTFMNSVISSEAFVTEPELYLPKEFRPNLLKCKPNIDSAILIRPEKSSYRALMDFIAKCSR